MDRRGQVLLHDVVPVVVLAAASTTALVRMRDGDPGGGTVAVSLLLWLPALARRRLPLPVFAVTAVLVAAHWLPGGLDADALLPADAALLLALFTVAERCPLPWTAAAAGVTELFALASLLGGQTSGPEHPVVPLSALTLAATLLGRNRRARSALVADLQDRAERAERERDSLARAAVAEERTRIAREVHDVVSHNLSVMTALADGAGYALRTDTGPARAQAADAVAAVATTGREALGEMHRLLGLLRAGDGADDPGEASRRPAPGLADLPALVEQVRAAGLPTTLTVTGSAAPLGTAAQLAVYRLVQEALTNTRKHAPGAHAAEVALEWADRGLTVRVRDDGPPGTAATGVGHGLVGMRERFGAHGGTVSAGPATPRGWLVEALLPVPVPAR